jgi:hypothetical protein
VPTPAPTPVPTPAPTPRPTPKPTPPPGGTPQTCPGQGVRTRDASCHPVHPVKHVKQPHRTRASAPMPLAAVVDPGHDGEQAIVDNPRRGPKIGRRLRTSRSTR